LSAASSDLLLNLKKKLVDLPSVFLELANLTPGEDCIVKVVVVDIEFNMSSREEYPSIAEVTSSVINRGFHI
jgi:hypothetical protein